MVIWMVQELVIALVLGLAEGSGFPVTLLLMKNT